MKKFILNLQFIFKPSYWCMVSKYNKDIDVLVNDLLDEYEFTKIDRCTAFLNNVEIWISNRPYACMIPYALNHDNVRPSRLTIQKGIKKLKKAEFDYKTNELKSKILKLKNK